jgi:RNA polymerase sigma-70 factor, ECF subfamily
MNAPTAGCGRGGDGGSHARRTRRHGHPPGGGPHGHADLHPRRGGSSCEPHAATDHLKPLEAPGPPAEAAFAERVRDHIPGMVRLARRFVGSDDLAWDAVQESLLALWQTPSPPSEMRPWLSRVVIHRCLHIRRTLRRRWHYEGRAGTAVVADAPVRDPAEELALQGLRAQLRLAVSRLPLGQLRAFVLREIEGLEYADIAGRLGVPIGTIRSRLARARGALRDALGAADRLR